MRTRKKMNCVDNANWITFDRPWVIRIAILYILNLKKKKNLLVHCTKRIFCVFNLRFLSPQKVPSCHSVLSHFFQSQGWLFFCPNSFAISRMLCKSNILSSFFGFGFFHSILLLRFISVVAFINSFFLFFFSWEVVYMVWRYHNLFFHLPIGGHMDCF